jgi:CHASE3 domain sensor protein
MSSLEAFVIVCVVLLVGTPVCLWQIHRAWRAEQAKNDDPYEVGPDALRLLQDLDTHLDEYVAADTELAAGFARLRAAVRDEQQKGDQK